jgi:hypothetical protein
LLPQNQIRNRRFRRSEPLGPQQGVGQVKQQPRSDEGGERIIEDHFCSPPERFRAKRVPVRVKKTRQKLEPFAGVGVTYRHHEEAQTEGQYDDVQHELLLVALVSVRNFCTFPGRRMDQYQLASDRVS